MRAWTCAAVRLCLLRERRIDHNSLYAWGLSGASLRRAVLLDKRRKETGRELIRSEFLHLDMNTELHTHTHTHSRGVQADVRQTRLKNQRAHHGEMRGLITHTNWRWIVREQGHFKEQEQSGGWGGNCGWSREVTSKVRQRLCVKWKRCVNVRVSTFGRDGRWNSN